jgi:hypothetical protein
MQPCLYTGLTAEIPVLDKSVIGYECDSKTMEYSFCYERVRLKEGTVIDEWQEDNGQWWRKTVVRDTATVVKLVTRKIDAPSRATPSADHAE